MAVELVVVVGPKLKIENISLKIEVEVVTPTVYDEVEELSIETILLDTLVTV